MLDCFPLDFTGHPLVQRFRLLLDGCPLECLLNLTSRSRVSEANERFAKHIHHRAIERHWQHWNPLGPPRIPLSPDAACVPLAADEPRKDSISLLQAPDSHGSLCLVLSESYLRLLLTMCSWTFPAKKNPSVVLCTREGALRRDCNPKDKLFRYWKVYQLVFTLKPGLRRSYPN